jgi:invasion protein IalB
MNMNAMLIASGAAFAASLLALPAATASGLPGGATSLTETHADWTLNCGVQPAVSGGAIACSVGQAQFDKASKRRILTFAVSPQSGGGVKGVVVLPFGLSLDKGVTFQLDAGSITPAAHFRTCLPAGCLVSLDWPDGTVKAMRTATTLKIAATTANGQAAPFSLPMSGFAAALDRAVALTAKP